MRFALALLTWLIAAPALAVLPHEMLADPALEARARELSRELRCQVCQNQSIDDSNAPLAADLRRAVRERLVAGDSDSGVLAFVAERYGDNVLMRPPVKPATYALWFGPAIVLALGALGAIVHMRRRRPVAEAPLSEDERRRLGEITNEGRTP